MHQCQEKRQEKSDKKFTPTQTIVALMGEEEKNRKQKEETGSGPPTQLPGPFGRLLRPAWIILWAYSEPSPHPQGNKDIIIEEVNESQNNGKPL